jgi:DNA-binding GntR family transcriptional regulator
MTTSSASPARYVLRVEEISAVLRREIVEGRLAPGSHIHQEALAQRLGVSRVPVREALLQLANEGLVTLVPNAGAHVSTLDLAELHEIYLLRERLEPFLLATSCVRLEEATIAQLRELAAEMERLVTVVDGDERCADEFAWLELDQRFHQLTFVGADLPHFRALSEGFWNATQRYRHAYMLLPHRYEITHREHAMLLDVIDRRAAADAEGLLLMHIRRTRVTLEAHPEFFDAEGRLKALAEAASPDAAPTS